MTVRKRHGRARPGHLQLAFVTPTKVGVQLSRPQYEWRKSVMAGLDPAISDDLLVNN
jgi:hypothetical protein